MLGVTLVFGLPMLVAGGMIDPQGLPVRGLISVAGIMLVVVPIGGWFVFATQLVLPTAGRSRLGAVFNLWIGGTLTAVAVIYWLYAALGYPRPDARIDVAAHALIPFAPRAGLAIGLFCLSMLVSSGVVGAVAPILRPEVAIRSAVIGGVVLFGLVYGCGYLLLIT
jgi:hypothetical protein